MSNEDSNVKYIETDLMEPGNNVHSAAELMSPEQKRLAGRAPLPNLLAISFGPLLIQVTSSLYGIIATIWIERALKEIGITSISLASAFDYIGRSFGFFVSSAGACTIGALYGRKESDKAGQVICDLLRVALAFGILIPAILIPCLKPAFRWFGADEQGTKLAYEYMFPLSMSTVTTCIYLGAMGFLNGEGRSLISGLITVFSSVLNMAVFCPLFLLWRPVGIAGAAYSTIITEGTAGIVVVILYFCGAFGCKPKFSMLFNKFSPETWQSLKIGLSQLCSNISIEVPGILMRKLIGMTTSVQSEFDSAMAGFNIVFRYSQFTNSVILAVIMGFVPCAAYAYGAKLYTRWMDLQFHANWISILWGGISMLLTWVIPGPISKLFDSHNNPEFVRFATPMLKYANSMGIFTFSRFTMPAMLQSIQRGNRATVLSLLSQFVAMIALAFMMYGIDKHSPIKLMWSMSLTYVVGTILGIGMLWGPVTEIWRNSKAEKLDLNARALLSESTK